MAIVTSLLFMQYRRVTLETKKILELKEDYRNHLLAVNKVVQEFNKNKERLEELEQLASEKKKSNNQLAKKSSSAFPADMQVFSSDDECSSEESFVAVSRDLEYLKQATLDYIKEQNLQMILSRLDINQWSDYTQEVVERDNQPTVVGKKKRGKKKKVQAARVPKNLKTMLNMANVKQDMTLRWPIDRSNFWISSPFGPRKRKSTGLYEFHSGIDMAACKGTSVFAATIGVVVEAGVRSGYGKTILIAHNRKYRTRYAHLDSILVRVGQEVTQGDLIGKVGATGLVRGKYPWHLHFMVYAFGKPVNPLVFLS